MRHPYSTSLYAASLAHIGRPVDVPAWGAHVLARTLPGGVEDVAGVYPITPLDPDADLDGGMRQLRGMGFISVTLVVDDVHRPSLADLRQSFSVVRSFKTHHVWSPEHGEFRCSKHHRYEIRRARGSVVVGPLDLSTNLAEWERLYANLAVRRALGQAHLFRPEHVSALACMTGMTALGGWANGELVSAHLWARHGGRYFSHLAASSEAGYTLGAAYAVNDESLRSFHDARLVNFGGSPGPDDSLTSGLARFKRGFSNGVAQSYLCGAVLNPPVYDALCRTFAVDADTAYFPAYRRPEAPSDGELDDQRHRS